MITVRLEGNLITTTSRDAVLDAACLLFAERGYRGTSMKDIAEALGVRAPSLYNHVASKPLSGHLRGQRVRRIRATRRKLYRGGRPGPFGMKSGYEPVGLGAAQEIFGSRPT